MHYRISYALFQGKQIGMCLIIFPHLLTILNNSQDVV